MPAFDSVLFDLDGTLWDASPACALAWNRSLAAFGLASRTVTAAEARSFTGLPFEVIFGRFFPEVPPGQHRDFIEVYRTLEDEVVQTQGGSVYPGTREALERLGSRARLFIVSNCLDGYIENFFRHTGLGSHFEGYECLGRTGKPKADNIASVIRSFGLKAPVYVGDTAHDHDAARQNGVPFAWASYGFGQVAGADFRVGSLGELEWVVISD